MHKIVAGKSEKKLKVFGYQMSDLFGHTQRTSKINGHVVDVGILIQREGRKIVRNTALVCEVRNEYENSHVRLGKSTKSHLYVRLVVS